MKNKRICFVISNSDNTSFLRALKLMLKLEKLSNFKNQACVQAPTLHTKPTKLRTREGVHSEEQCLLQRPGSYKEIINF